MKINKKGQLLSLRIIGILLLLLSAYIVWDNNSGDSSKTFWSFRRSSQKDIYSIQGNWINQSGKEVRLNKFRGKVSIISFNFLECNKSCPQLVHDLKLLDSTIETNKDKLQFLVFLFDDVRNSPIKIKEFIKRHEINNKYWHVLTSNKENLNNLTEELLIKYEVIDKEISSYIHTNYIGIIGSDGKIIKSYYGWQYETTKLVTEILNLTNKL